MPDSLFLRMRIFLGRTGCAAAALWALVLIQGCRPAPAPPNIVIFLADDLGYGDLGCYGNPINLTPHIDRLALEGTRFTDFHSAGTVCSPSRASLLTGRHPYRLGFYYILGGGAHLQRKEITIATLLRQAGYDTCFVGKWHLTQLDRPGSGTAFPEEHGFDHWFGTTVNAFEGPDNPQKFLRNGTKVGPIGQWYCDAIVAEAADWLESRPEPRKPFFLYVSSHEPHTPIIPPEAYANRFDNEDVERLEDSIFIWRSTAAGKQRYRVP